MIDPPWENRSVKRSRRYATLPAPTLAHLPLEALMHPEGCLVALWVTNRERIRRCVDEELLPALGLVCAAKWHWLKLTDEGRPVSPLVRVCHGGLLATGTESIQNLTNCATNDQ